MTAHTRSRQGVAYEESCHGKGGIFLAEMRLDALEARHHCPLVTTRAPSCLPLRPSTDEGARGLVAPYLIWKQESIAPQRRTRFFSVVLFCSSARTNCGYFELKNGGETS